MNANCVCTPTCVKCGVAKEVLTEDHRWHTKYCAPCYEKITLGLFVDAMARHEDKRISDELMAGVNELFPEKK